MAVNIIFAGVGGQGLILATRIVTQAAANAGLAVSGSDVFGLAQRGGSVWGMVRIGNRHFAPMIAKGQVDILVGLEELEGLRWSGYLKPGGTAIINNNQVYPTSVLLEKDEYPQDTVDQLRRRGYRVLAVDGPGSARRLGNPRLANTVVLGVLARELEIPQEHWLRAIAGLVPPKTIELNLKAFQLG